MMWLVMALWPQPAHSVVGPPLYSSRVRPMWLWPLTPGWDSLAATAGTLSPLSWLVPLVGPRAADSSRLRPSSGTVASAWIWLASTRGTLSGTLGSLGSMGVLFFWLMSC